jgi:membrane peptidoglycan carboxypeptidase
MLGWTVLALVVFGASTAGGLLAAPVDFTPPPAQRPALILDRNGKIIGEIATPEQRVEVAASQIPDVMRNAVVAAEDRTFYSNSGVAPVSIVRAALNDVAGRATQGGSTITQQYVKDVYVGSQHTFLRKLREAALAIRLDQRLSKTEILTRYLNEVYFGQGAYGIEAAAQYYFDIPAAGLSLPQASMLAGLISAPSANNPVVNLAGARARQHYVLGRMAADGYITQATATTAYATSPTIAKHVTSSATASIAPQFTAAVTAAVKAKYAADPNELYESGMAIHTTLDSSWQQAATTALAAVLPKATDPEASVVVMDSDTGQVLAVADKVDADHPYLDTSQSVRVSGSTVKPFTLAAALESGKYTIDTPVEAPSSKTYPVSECGTVAGGGPYTITNDEGGGGYYTLQSALADSVNTVYGPLAITVGRTEVAATAAATGLLSASSAAEAATACSMGLGVPVTPLDEAEAYSTLADGGVRHTPTDIASISEGVDATGGGGATVYQPTVTTSRAVPADVDGQVVQAMRAVVRYGTGTAAQQPSGLDVFGKTGTTDNYTNAWFSGCVPAYHVCMTTWIGYDSQNTTMTDVEGVHDVTGGSLPAQVFAQAMDGYRTLANPVVTAPSSSAPAPTPTLTATLTPGPSTPTSISVPPSTVLSTPPTTTSSSAAPPATSGSMPPTTPPAISPSAPIAPPTGASPG